jgi:acyl carrier protein
MRVLQAKGGEDRMRNLMSEITAVIRESLLVEPSSPHEDLLESGVLDSLTLIQLLVQMEDRFGVTIPLAELDIDDIRSVASLARLVADQTIGYVASS